MMFYFTSQFQEFGKNILGKILQLLEIIYEDNTFFLPAGLN